jgi:hypothetical protein
MRNILFVIVMLMSTSAFSADLLRSWECGEYKCAMYNDDTFLVGDLLYNIHYDGEYLVLYAGSKAMLYVKKQKGSNGITIINTNNSDDRRHYVVCP